MKNKIKVSFPNIGDYTPIFENLLKELNVEIVRGELTEKTISEGVQHSPVMMCYPYKITLGYLIDTLNKGANKIVHFSSCGRCRFRHYWKLQAHTLKKIGYNFEIIPLKAKSIISDIKKINPEISYTKIIKLIFKTWKKINSLEKNKPEYNLNIDKKNINILIFGEIFTVLDPKANLNIVEKIKKMGAEPKFALSLSHFIKDGLIRIKDKYKRQAQKKVDGPTGGHGLHSIANVFYAFEKKFDGVIHVLPMSCAPEILVQPLIASLCSEKEIPLLTVECDENNSEVNIETRLETFIELIKRKKGKNNV